MRDDVNNILVKSQAIVDDLLEKFLNEREWPDVTSFQIENEADISVLDALEREQIVLQSNSRYMLSFGAMQDSRHWPSVLRIVGRMYPVLRQMYLQSPKVNWSPTSIAERIKPTLEMGDIQVGLSLLNRLALLGGHTAATNGEIANFLIGNSVVRFKTLDDVLKNHHESSRRINLIESNTKGVATALSDSHQSVSKRVEKENLIDLHPKIYDLCRQLFESGALAESVEKGFKIVRDRLRELTGYETGSEAFGKTKLHIKGSAAPHVDEDFQQAVKFLTMAIDRFRNEKTHVSNAKIDSPVRAHEYLRLSSLAMRLLDDAEVI
jgi:uncharacterized protein (TIGR02391 family)